MGIYFIFRDDEWKNKIISVRLKIRQESWYAAKVEARYMRKKPIGQLIAELLDFSTHIHHRMTDDDKKIYLDLIEKYSRITFTGMEHIDEQNDHCYRDKLK